MENSELIRILKLLSKAETEKPKLNEELINKVIEKVLLEYKPRIAVGGDGQLMISLHSSEVLPSLGTLDIGTNERKPYLKEAMQRILKVLGEMVFNETEPESEIEKKIFEKLNVPELRVKAKLKKVHTLPVVDVIEVHPVTIELDGVELKYYLLKIEHLKGKKPVTINFIMTRGDLMKLHSAIGEVLNDGNVTQGN